MKLNENPRVQAALRDLLDTLVNESGGGQFPLKALSRKGFERLLFSSPGGRP